MKLAICLAALVVWLGTPDTAEARGERVDWSEYLEDKNSRSAPLVKTTPEKKKPTAAKATKAKSKAKAKKHKARGKKARRR